MSITMNLYYTGTNGSARKFAEEMEQSGTAAMIRAEDGNLRYDYFLPMSDPETVLLIDSWKDQASLDIHHASPMMGTAGKIRPAHAGGAVCLGRSRPAGRRQEVYQDLNRHPAGRHGYRPAGCFFAL